jgi:nucleotidyltransferase-like protein
MYYEKPIRNIRLENLIEREKELNCLYKVIETLEKEQQKPEHIFKDLITIIPSGWQYSTICEVKITFEEQSFQSPDFTETEWMQVADITVDENIVGKIQLVYSQLIRKLNNSQFLPDEQKLLNTIAQKIGDYFFFQKLKKTLEYINKPGKSENNKDELLSILSPESNEHWIWRLKMSQKIADKMDFEKFAVKGVYICGSTKNADAGPASDIDLIIHANGNEQQNAELKSWIEGWGMALTELNYSKTGYEIPEGLIDLHIVSDQDIENKTSFGCMIGSLYNSARPLRLKNQTTIFSNI